MRVTITKPHDIVTARNAAGTPTACVAYTPTNEPITVKREHGEELVAAGAAVEIAEPAKRKPAEPIFGKGDEEHLPSCNGD